MTPPEPLATAGAVLLDFDGPACSIFAGYPAPDVAEHLRQVVRSNGVPTEGSVLSEADPLEVLEYVAQHNLDLLDTVEEALRPAEIEAANTAAPTLGADRFVRQTAQTRIPLVVVSNNSAAAIEVYLGRHNLTPFVTGVVGRPFTRADLMKPNPWPIVHAAELIHIPVDRCVLIGDSDTDVIAARAAGAQCLGYANRPAKETTLTAAGAVMAVTSMRELLSELA